MAGCTSASVGRDWEGSSTPHGWQKPPCFDRIQRGGEQVFQLCPCGERIKLRGHAAGWHGELVRCVIVSIPAPMAPRICVAPVVPKEAPKLITFTVCSLENCASCNILSLGERWWRTAQWYLIWSRRYIKALSVQFPCKGSRQRWQGQGSEPSAMVKQKCHFRAGWDRSRRLAEISVLPIAPCLRRSASVPEILRLGRQTRCPRAMARLPQETMVA